eukprot:scaffold48632_cov59-Phaeocystis_antarctica.AAC.4
MVASPYEPSELLAVITEPLRSASTRFAPVKSMLALTFPLAVRTELLRLAFARLAPLKSMRMPSVKPLAVTFEPLRSAWARPAPFSLTAPVPVNVASLKSPYDRCAPLRSSSLSAPPSVVSLHAIGQLLSPAGRCLSISTVHGGAGGGGGAGLAGREGESTPSTSASLRASA